MVIDSENQIDVVFIAVYSAVGRQWLTCTVVEYSESVVTPLTHPKPE